MEEIILQQKEAAKALSGKAFLLSVAGIVLRLAIAQIVVNLLISMTGVGLLNIVFYLYAVWLLVGFMRRTVASYVYTLKRGVVFLEKKLGDSTNSLVEVPLSRVVSMRPVYMAERLETSYRQVTVIDPAARPAVRVRAAFVMSLFSARLARLLAGKRADEQIGYVIVFVEDGQRHACVFRPNEAMCAALEEQLGEAYGFDERMTQAKAHTLYARALQRAFPALYAYVDPLVKPGDVEWAKREIDAQKAQRREKAAAKKGGKTAGGHQEKHTAEKDNGSGKTDDEDQAQAGEKRRRRTRQE